MARHTSSGAPRGFSVIEWTIAITILLILSALILPGLMNTGQRTQLARAHGDVSGIGQAISKMRADTGMTLAACLTNTTNLVSNTLPSSCNIYPGGTPYAVTMCTQASSGQACWAGPYLSAIQPDPWGTAYKVTMPTASTWSVVVDSAGPNGLFGDTDDISYVQ
jgi:type II secretory pathway pseudopilin PulG